MMVAVHFESMAISQRSWGQERHGPMLLHFPWRLGSSVVSRALPWYLGVGGDTRGEGVARLLVQFEGTAPVLSVGQI